MLERFTRSQTLSDDEKEIITTVDVCKIRPSPPRNLLALLDIVEVFVGYGWHKGLVKEILNDNQYKMCFEATKEEVVF